MKIKITTFDGMLKNVKNDSEWTEMGPDDFIEVTEKDSSKVIGLHFRCPGCNSIIGVMEPTWEIDRASMTAKPSILHDRGKGGCGWHGYLTNGHLKGKIE